MTLFHADAASAVIDLGLPHWVVLISAVGLLWALIGGGVFVGNAFLTRLLDG